MIVCQVQETVNLADRVAGCLVVIDPHTDGGHRWPHDFVDAKTRRAHLQGRMIWRGYLVKGGHMLPFMKNNANDLILFKCYFIRTLTDV